MSRGNIYSPDWSRRAVMCPAAGRRDTVPTVRQLLTFVVVGLTATAIQYSILVAGVEIIGLPVALSSGIGFVVSSVANYLLNYRLTFRSLRTHVSAGVRFIVVALGGLVINIICMILFTEHLHIRYILSQVFATGFAFVWTFFGNALWSFSNPTRHRHHDNDKET